MDLLLLLEALGLEGLRAGNREISGICPAHYARTGHVDSRPSWSINRETGAHICFSCGWKGGLASVYEALGQQAPQDIDLELLRQQVKAGISRAVHVPHEPVRYDQSNPMIVDMFWLRAFDPMPHALLDLKHLTPDAATHFDILWDSQNRRWVIPIKTPQGDLMGVQYRQPGVHEVNYPVGIQKSETLFGLDSLPPDTPTVLVVESPLDVVRLWSAGIPAVATFGVYISQTQISLLARHFTYVVVGFDNPAIDEPGAKGTSRLIQSLRRLNCPAFPFRYEGLLKDDTQLPAKDPGEVLSDQALQAAWSASRKAPVR